MSEAGGLALGKDGSVYVGDAFNHQVLKFRPHQGMHRSMRLAGDIHRSFKEVSK